MDAQEKREIIEINEMAKMLVAKTDRLLVEKPKKKRKDKFAEVRAALERDHVKMFGRARNR